MGFSCCKVTFPVGHERSTGRLIHGLRARSGPVRKLQFYSISRFQAQEGGHLMIVRARASKGYFTQCDEESFIPARATAMYKHASRAVRLLVQ